MTNATEATCRSGGHAVAICFSDVDNFSAEFPCGGCSGRITPRLPVSCAAMLNDRQKWSTEHS
ncbi:MAG: hypothetical protein CMJ47_01765 [Planctomyces sp.]|nr:hypothetical protein [Planctomyces sp.]